MILCTSAPRLATLGSVTGGWPRSPTVLSQGAGVVVRISKTGDPSSPTRASSLYRNGLLKSWAVLWMQNTLSNAVSQSTGRDRPSSIVPTRRSATRSAVIVCVNTWLNRRSRSAHSSSGRSPRQYLSYSSLASLCSPRGQSTSVHAGMSSTSNTGTHRLARIS